jgi:uncharacterized RDD family membrane protein YckC
MALALDSLIQISIIIVLYLAVLALVLATENLSESSWFLVGVILAFFLIFTLYFIVFELAMNGQTPGKRIVGLRVVKENGYPLNAIDVIVRNLVRLVDFFPVAYSLGLIVMLFNERSRRLGDYAAGTLVIRDRQPLSLDTVQAILRTQEQAVREVAAAAQEGIERDALARLNERDIQMIESFLQRRYTIANAQPLAKTIADAITQRLQTSDWVAQRATLNDVDFLKGVVAAYRGRSSL